jgi:hypothetical protein
MREQTGPSLLIGVAPAKAKVAEPLPPPVLDLDPAVVPFVHGEGDLHFGGVGPVDPEIRDRRAAAGAPR